ncbi:MAG: hypothetical protein KDD62_08855, partial [Bdellovibrionales bacterium]|nr:hypothetical protein [Bdellovibrionales bacterium]
AKLANSVKTASSFSSFFNRPMVGLTEKLSRRTAELNPGQVSLLSCDAQSGSKLLNLFQFILKNDFRS